MSKGQSVGPTKGGPLFSSSTVQVFVFCKRSCKSGFSMYNLPFFDMLVQKFFTQHSGQAKHIYEPTFFLPWLWATLTTLCQLFPTLKGEPSPNTSWCARQYPGPWGQRWRKHNSCPQGGQHWRPPTSRQPFPRPSVKFSATVTSWV